MVDQERLKKAFTEILLALGENPNREGLVDSPGRFAKMCAENFDGIQYSNEDIAKMYGVTFEEEGYLEEASDDFVLVKDIDIFSYCEHHFALMYNMKVAVAYIPKEKVIGLSKIARVAELVGKRLQLQERIGKDIAQIIQMIAEVEDVAVIIEGEHSCMTTRGIKKPGTKTISKTFRGKFEKDRELANQVIGLYR